MQVHSTGLYSASQCGFVAVVRLLLDYGAEVDNTCFGVTPLSIACEKGHVDVARALLAYGANKDKESNGKVGCGSVGVCACGERRVLW